MSWDLLLALGVLAHLEPLNRLLQVDVRGEHGVASSTRQLPRELRVLMEDLRRLIRFLKVSHHQHLLRTLLPCLCLLAGSMSTGAAH